MTSRTKARTRQRIASPASQEKLSRDSTSAGRSSRRQTWSPDPFEGDWDERVWVLIDHKEHVVHRLKTGLSTFCELKGHDEVGRYSFQEAMPRRVTCLLCLAES